MVPDSGRGRMPDVGKRPATPPATVASTRSHARPVRMAMARRRRRWQRRHGRATVPIRRADAATPRAGCKLLIDRRARRPHQPSVSKICPVIPAVTQDEDLSQFAAAAGSLRDHEDRRVAAGAAISPREIPEFPARLRCRGCPWARRRGAPLAEEQRATSRDALLLAAEQRRAGGGPDRPGPARRLPSPTVEERLGPRQSEHAEGLRSRSP